MAKEKVIVAIDQSTAATKTVIFSKRAEILAKSLIPHKQHYPASGWVEHDPKEIAHNLVESVVKATEDASLSFRDVDSIAITNQRRPCLSGIERLACRSIMLLSGRIAELDLTATLTSRRMSTYELPQD